MPVPNSEQSRMPTPASNSPQAPSFAVPKSIVDDTIQLLTLRLARGLAKISWITPNLITCVSALLGGAVASGLIYIGQFRTAAGFVILSGIFDGLDGDLARERNISSAEGAILDSVLDRYVDFLLISAMILVAPQDNLWPGLLALLGTTTVPYIRARSEAEGKSTIASVGSRSIRVIVLIVSLIVHQLFWGLVAIAFVANVAAIHRLIYGVFPQKTAQDQLPHR